MADNEDRLLVEFDVRVHDLIALCEERKEKINELSVLLEQKESELKEAIQKINELHKKNDLLLTAHSFSLKEGSIKNAKQRVSNLVRKIDKCIALLNA